MHPPKKPHRQNVSKPNREHSDTQTASSHSQYCMPQRTRAITRQDTCIAPTCETMAQQKRGGGIQTLRQQVSMINTALPHIPVLAIMQCDYTQQASTNKP